MNIKELGDQLQQLKNHYFGKRDELKVDAAFDAQPPEEEEKEVRATVQNNFTFGFHPDRINQSIYRHHGIEAVFENKKDETDSWQDKSVQAQDSNKSQDSGQHSTRGEVQLNDVGLLLNEPPRIQSVRESQAAAEKSDKPTPEVGSHVMGPKDATKFASQRNLMKHDIV